MKFDFKPVKKKIDLGEYAEEMAGAVIEVRVNVSRETLAAMWAVGKDTPNETFFALLNEIWDAGTPLGTPSGGPGAWPIEDIRALFGYCKEFDPQLWRWVTERTFQVIYEYQAGQKKE